jgi:hypothetical protein
MGLGQRHKRRKMALAEEEAGGNKGQREKRTGASKPQIRHAYKPPLENPLDPRFFMTKMGGGGGGRLLSLVPHSANSQQGGRERERAGGRGGGGGGERKKRETGEVIPPNKLGRFPPSPPLRAPPSPVPIRHHPSSRYSPSSLFSFPRRQKKAEDCLL